ncbi:MAG: hypothetical protein JO256_03725 [Alphaproteobacteria bacterium]|nr:hypothetical protein [Alphaproteobacteria bacterium]
MLHKTAIASLTLVLSAHSAFASCLSERETAALKIASLQQRLMVAGLACRADEAYNRFVLAHRAELQRSDDDLKAYFTANGGEAGYDSYKTRLANLAAHGPATDQQVFCDTAGRDFRALSNSGDLLALAGYEALLVGRPCEAQVMAAAAPITVAAAPLRLARNDDVVAVTPRELPAMPYAEAPPPRPAPQVAVATREDSAAAPQPVAAGRDDYADLPHAARNDDAYIPPRPAARSDRYWYYRRLYHAGS